MAGWGIYHFFANARCGSAIKMPIDSEGNILRLPEMEGAIVQGARMEVVVPLMVGCVFLIAYIPWAASRGKYHVAGYGGMAIVGILCGLVLGRLSGARGINGTIVGRSLGSVFFMLMAVAVGCIVAVFCYRPPTEQ
jgi:hypothetical protein